ncbi:fatty acyl-AMP ligase [Acetobacter thailandicus]|uniref:fatty acyl-AMP ligase n=1 Tax=Acetobacter thailandicus TaxID=1502842 RepID=UPI001BA4626B|nr:fatty acyl-AMP ligase [Acetobacter thailandicus]MBS1003831.1 fatty acyl-AMP ligase [Acetobacter thailandicus]
MTLMNSAPSLHNDESLQPVPSSSGQPRRYGDFPTFPAALDYAAQGDAGLNIYSGKGLLLEALPYKKLRNQAVQTAQRLLGTGLKPGDKVAIIADSDGDFARIFFGCQYAGLVAAPLPLPVAFAGKEAYLATLRGMISSAEAKAVIIPDVIADWTSDIIGGLDLVFAGSPTELFDRPAFDTALPEIETEALSYLQFSSGSTRFPMGVCVSQRSGMANAMSIARDGLQVRQTGDRCVSWLPLYHDMGLVGFFLTPMTCQLTVDLLPTREFARRPHVWLDLISRNRGTLSYSPSFGYELCARRAPAAGLDLSSWRVAGIGGDMIRPHVLAEFAECFAPAGFDAHSFEASYGMAETTLAISFAPLGTGIETDTIDLDILESEGVATPPTHTSTTTRTFVLCGRVLPGHAMEVRDQNGEALPDRKVGTIFVHGPSLMDGYYRHPEETRNVLDEQKWLNTGDLGYMLNGQVVVTGRAKDLIIINARNIWPQDLEWSAETHLQALRSNDVAVFAVEKDNKEHIVALIQCRATDPEKRAALQSEAVSLFRRLHGLDVAVTLVPPRALPQTSSGKLTRAKARTMFLNGEFTPQQ